MSGEPDRATQEEARLVAQAQAGSHDAMVALYERHRGRVIGYITRMTGDRDLADEVFAATFVAFFTHLDTYRHRGQLAAYLLRIARSCLANEGRARNRLGTSLDSGATDEDRAGGPIDDRIGPFEAASDAELVARAEEALRGLSAPLREVVVLRLYEDLSHAEIAEVVGVGEATVRSRLRYALQALRRAMNAVPES